MESSPYSRANHHPAFRHRWLVPQVTLMLWVHNGVPMALRITLGRMVGVTTLPICCAETLNFDQARIGSVPAGWTTAMTHEGGAPKWEVISDDSAPSRPNVLVQVSTDRTAGRFP